MDPLEQLRAALEEFMAAGGDPAEAQAMMEELAGGGMPPAEGGDMGLGGMPPGDEMEGDLETAPPLEGDMGAGMLPLDDEMPPPQPEAKTFGAANAGATERLKKLNRR